MRGNRDKLGRWEASQNVPPARVGFHGRLKIDALDIERRDKTIHWAAIWGYRGANDTPRPERASERTIVACHDVRPQLVTFMASADRRQANELLRDALAYLP